MLTIVKCNRDVLSVCVLFLENTFVVINRITLIVKGKQCIFSLSHASFNYRITPIANLFKWIAL